MTAFEAESRLRRTAEICGLCPCTMRANATDGASAPIELALSEVASMPSSEVLLETKRVGNDDTNYYDMN